MNYTIYFDESNKLDQPRGKYSYYGALGIKLSTKEKLTKTIQEINEELSTKSELHFVDYTSDTHFEKYIKTLNYVLKQENKKFRIVCVPGALTTLPVCFIKT